MEPMWRDRDTSSLACIASARLEPSTVISRSKHFSRRCPKVSSCGTIFHCRTLGGRFGGNRSVPSLDVRREWTICSCTSSEKVASLTTTSRVYPLRASPTIVVLVPGVVLFGSCGLTPAFVALCIISSVCVLFSSGSRASSPSYPPSPPSPSSSSTSQAPSSHANHCETPKSPPSSRSP